MSFIPVASRSPKRKKLPSNWLVAWRGGLIDDTEVLDLLKERANQIKLTEVIELLASLDVADIADADTVD